MMNSFPAVYMQTGRGKVLLKSMFVYLGTSVEYSVCETLINYHDQLSEQY